MSKTFDQKYISAPYKLTQLQTLDFRLWLIIKHHHIVRNDTGAKSRLSILIDNFTIRYFTRNHCSLPLFEVIHNRISQRWLEYNNTMPVSTLRPIAVFVPVQLDRGKWYKLPSIHQWERERERGKNLLVVVVCRYRKCHYRMLFVSSFLWFISNTSEKCYIVDSCERGGKRIISN